MLLLLMLLSSQPQSQRTGERRVAGGARCYLPACSRAAGRLVQQALVVVDLKVVHYGGWQGIGVRALMLGVGRGLGCLSCLSRSIWAL